MSARRRYHLECGDAVAVHAQKSNYLSFTLDLGQIAEPTRFWNPDGSGETVGQRRSFDFTRKKLINLTRALAPAYMRIGGTEADRCHYALDHTSATQAPPPPPHPYGSTLTAAHLEAMAAFARATGVEVMLTVNAGWALRGPDGGAWDSRDARALMRFLASRGHAEVFSVYELGNEPNAWPLFHKGLSVSPEQYAHDLKELQGARDDEAPHARIAAPSTAFWPTLGEVPAHHASAILRALGLVALWPVDLILGKTRVAPRPPAEYLQRVLTAAARLDAIPEIVTWHFYPSLSTRSKLAAHRSTAAMIGVVAAAAAVAAACGLTHELRSAGGVKMAASSPPWSSAILHAVLLLVATCVALVCAALQLVVRPCSAARLRDPQTLDTVLRWGDQVRGIVVEASGGLTLDPIGKTASGEVPVLAERHREEQRKVPAVWLGETGSAQVGGQPGVSGTWAATLWWLDQLGAVARLGHSAQCRQTLVGADYGLLDEATLEPTPEFWASVIFRRLMGESPWQVRTVESSLINGGADGEETRGHAAPLPSTLRVYCHSKHGGAPAGREPCCYLAINLGTDAVNMQFPTMATRAHMDMDAEVWLLESGASDGRTLTINGLRPATEPDGFVPKIPGVRLATGNVELPAGSAAFVRADLRHQRRGRLGHQGPNSGADGEHYAAGAHPARQSRSPARRRR